MLPTTDTRSTTADEVMVMNELRVNMAKVNYFSKALEAIANGQFSPHEMKKLARTALERAEEPL